MAELKPCILIYQRKLWRNLPGGIWILPTCYPEHGSAVAATQSFSYYEHLLCFFGTRMNVTQKFHEHLLWAGTGPRAGNAPSWIIKNNDNEHYRNFTPQKFLNNISHLEENTTYTTHPDLFSQELFLRRHQSRTSMHCPSQAQVPQTVSYFGATHLEGHHGRWIFRRSCLSLTFSDVNIPGRNNRLTCTFWWMSCLWSPGTWPWGALVTWMGGREPWRGAELKAEELLSFKATMGLTPAQTDLVRGAGQLAEGVSVASRGGGAQHWPSRPPPRQKPRSFWPSPHHPHTLSPGLWSNPAPRGPWGHWSAKLCPSPRQKPHYAVF